MKLFLNNRLYLFLLFIVFFIALIIRVYKLGELPSGFHVDEASLGYNGYSLLHTGRDDAGYSFPLYIDMFGDNRPSGYHYLTILPIAIFGLSEFATRLPGALFGAFSIFAIYFLSSVLFSEKKEGEGHSNWVQSGRSIKISLVSAFFLAISPWHLVLSRASAETVVALFFILFGFGFILRSIRNFSIVDIVTGTFLLSLSFFFYHTPRVFVPLLFFVLIIFFLKDIFFSKRKVYRGAIIGFFLLLSFVSFLLVFVIAGGTGRFSQVNIFTHPQTKLILEEQLREDGMMKSNIILTRLFHNKVANYTLAFVKNYFEYFSGEFLFISGGLPRWYVIDGVGLLYIILLPAILYGIFLLLKSNNKFSKVVFIWLLLGPVVASITIDDIPNINRSIVMFPMFELIAAFGLVLFFEKKIIFSKFFIVVFSCALFGNFLYGAHQYYIQGTVHRPWYRNNGFGDMISYVKDNYNNYDKIIITKGSGGIYPLLLFYMRYDPVLYQKEGSTKDTEYTGFGKFYFVPQACPSTTGDARFPNTGRILRINKGECPDKMLIPYRDFYREDGTKVFRLEI